MDTPLPTTDTATATVPQEVPVNMWTTGEAVVVVAAMPGVRAEDIRIVRRSSMLELVADLRTPAPKDYLVHEWDYGNYRRVVQLPEGYRGDITASFGNGQLALRVAGGTPVGRTLPPDERGGADDEADLVIPVGVIDHPGRDG